MPTIDQDEINNVAWRACDAFRGAVDPADYKNYILVTLFLKYVSDVIKDHRAAYLLEFKGDEARVARRLSRERFLLPAGCDFDRLYAKRNAADIGQHIDIALEQIEEANKAKLEGVFREISFNSEGKLGQTRERNTRIKGLLEVHGMDSFRIEWGDTLRSPRLVEGDRLMKFDIVVANPPFSLDQWGIEDAEKDPFHRYHRGLPSRGKGDYAFITHMIETAREKVGRVGVVVPHGVLFRGAAEGRIRQKLVQENLLEAVIGLPANLFYGTGIPAAILLFNKGKTHGDVLFIDASRDYEDAKNKNRLTDAYLDKIVATYTAFESVDKYAYRATAQEIADNDYNLNIPRYVDTFEEEAEIDLTAVKKEIARIEDELVTVRKKMDSYLKELGL